MLKALNLLLRQIVVHGDLTVIDAKGVHSHFGDATGTRVVARIADRRTERLLLLDPQLEAGEAYMDGRLTIEHGDIYDFLATFTRNLGIHTLPRWVSTADQIRHLLRRIHQFNPVGRAQRNVAHHYDIDGAIYDLFLDPDRQYSCAYVTPGATLEEAQLAKKRHLAAKLRAGPGMRILDIGSGWGGLGLYLAHTTGADVKGVTLSNAQLALSRARARDQGLESTVHFDFEDYRHVEGRFDRIVSVGMFEHVGINHFHTFFRKLHDLLTDDGVAVIHAIGRSDGPGMTHPFIAKYIFPGGYIPALSEVFPAIERSGLMVTDVEILRLHYAETLRAWRERFRRNWDTAVALRGEPFARMWEYYLAGSEVAFRDQGMMVFQIQLTRRIDALPITRDYMLEDERALMRAEHETPHAPRLAGE
jgi:cyclopropane-fatty-acyl-phospholipid synthase